MYAVHAAYPQDLQGWRPSSAAIQGWRPAGTRMGQVSISESARVASSLIVGLAASVSGGLLIFSGNSEKPKPILKGIGWGVLVVGVITVGVNFFRVVKSPDMVQGS